MNTDKANGLDITKEYRAQIKDLEDNLESVGKLETMLKRSLGMRIVLVYGNFLISCAFLIIGIAGLAVVFLHLPKALAIVDAYYKLGVDIKFNQSSADLAPVFIMVKYILVTLFSLCIFISLLLMHIRYKNAFMLKFYSIVSDFKDQLASMVEKSRARYSDLTKNTDSISF